VSISQFKLTFELSPIILTNGIASQVPGGLMPIISLTQPNDFAGGITSQNTSNDDDFVAHFYPMPGATLTELDVAQYTFANQQVAANAVIIKPLKISLMMVSPAPTQGGYGAKLSAFTSLKKSLDQHNLSGGTYTVATPSYLYVDCLLLGIRDVSGDDTGQAQTRWQLDFYQPLLTLQAAQAAQNSLMSKWESGQQITGDPPSQSGAGPAVGTPASGVGPSVVPAAQATGGSSVAGPNPPPGGP
jgi:hypothetical protein